MATIEVLQPRLRQLKLSGMVDSIAARVQKARARPLDPLDFLLLLLEDELMRRESESIDRYIHRAHFDEVCDLRDFDFAYNPEIPKARIWAYVFNDSERGEWHVCSRTGWVLSAVPPNGPEYETLNAAVEALRPELEEHES
jgi:DNA replication protein DnaC